MLRFLKEMKFIFCTLLLSLIISKDIVLCANDDYTLEQVQVLFRHGDRVPDKVEVYKTDPYDSIFKELGYGQLTKAGKQREYEIGQVLREHYGSFLGEYKPENVFAFSTDTDRTKMSLNLVLAGLYPPTEKTSWSDEILWSPIPIRYEPNNINFLRGFDCSIYGKIFERTKFSPEVQKKISTYKNFYNHLKKTTGITTEDPFSPVLLYNNVRASKSLNLPLPEWCSPEDFKKLGEISGFALDSMVSTESKRRILVGPVIEKFLQNINSNKKIYLYSAHDLNVAAFTRVHNMTNFPPFPDYGSTIILEKLRGTDDQLFVRFYLWTGVSKTWMSLKMENCDEICPLSTYQEMVKPLLPNQLSRKCTTTQCKSTRIAENENDFDTVIPRLFAGVDLYSFKYSNEILSKFSRVE